jgi:hypothetical protein
LQLYDVKTSALEYEQCDMGQREDVEAFLNDFKQKLRSFGMVFLRSRGENLKTVLELELSENSVREHLANLAVENFYKGPSRDSDDGPDLWEFGKRIGGREVYIKITKGKFNKPVVCISFHFPARTITYPFND